MSIFIYTTELEDYQVKSFELSNKENRAFENESDSGKTTRVEIFTKRIYMLKLQNLTPAQTKSILNSLETNLYLPLDIKNIRIEKGYIGFSGVTDTTINFKVDKDKLKIDRTTYKLNYNLEITLEDKQVY